MCQSKDNKQRGLGLLTFVCVALTHLLLIYGLFATQSASIEIGSGGLRDMTEGAASGGLLKYVPIMEIPESVSVVQELEVKKKIAVHVETEKDIDLQVKVEKETEVKPEAIKPKRAVEKPKLKKPVVKNKKKQKSSFKKVQQGDSNGNADKAGYGGKSDLARGKSGEGVDEFTSAGHQGGYLNNPKPPYPALSIENREEGVVVLRVMVEVDGRPSSVEIVKSSGYRRLDQSAFKTVRDRFRFKPATRFGSPVRSNYTFSINFYLR